MLARSRLSSREYATQPWTVNERRLAKQASATGRHPPYRPTPPRQASKSFIRGRIGAPGCRLGSSSGESARAPFAARGRHRRRRSASTSRWVEPCLTTGPTLPEPGGHRQHKPAANQPLSAAQVVAVLGAAAQVERRLYPYLSHRRARRAPAIGGPRTPEGGYRLQVGNGEWSAHSTRAEAS